MEVNKYLAFRTGHLLLVLAVFITTAGLSCRDKPDEGSTLQKSYYNMYLPIGNAAKDLLTDQTYKKLIVEIDYMPGCKPDSFSIHHLKTFLQNTCRKPGGISVVVSPIAGSGNQSVGVQQAAQVEEINRSFFSTAGVLSVYVSILNTGFSDDKTLSACYYNTSACLFGKTIRNNTGGNGQASWSVTVANAIEHELGHLMGLVDRGTPMVFAHRDEAHGYHCDNPECLMYHNAETTDILGYLAVGQVPVLDSNCCNDLKAKGGK